MNRVFYRAKNFEHLKDVMYIAILGLFFGIVFLSLWEALRSTIFIGWGTGWRDLHSVFKFGIQSMWELVPHRVTRVFPFLVFGIFLHCLAVLIWKKPPKFFVLAFALANLVPIFVEISRVVESGYVARIGGLVAVVVWSILICLQWVVLWMSVWFFSRRVVNW
jgi:hypothetical protein